MRTRYGSKRTKIENDSRVTSKKTRRCIIDEDLIPRDLVIEILRRLPVKIVARFLLVSKLWSTIIRNQDFIRSFPYRSSSSHQPRLLFAFKDIDNQKQIWNFFSSSSSTSTKELPVSYLSRTTCSIFSSPRSRHNNVNEVPHYVNGLISIGSGREQVICNPSTGKSITLPKVKSRKLSIQSFLGYDPVEGQHKVLCMSEKLYDYWDTPSFEHQVFTLGVDKSWRMIECNILHRPGTNGMCINGVVYYGAYTGIENKEWCLARFDVRSEKFDQVIQFLGEHSPPSTYFSNPTLISYKRKVTLAIEVERGRFELWVLEDAEKHEWSKVCIFVHHSSVRVKQLRIIGDTTHTGEIVFALHHLKDSYVVYYNHKNRSFRYSGIIKENSHKELRRFSGMVLFFNYVESVLLF